ncbi:hypothetical protein CB0940_06473 [Cercospora beticola]|uniref:F-box domain-containing protein n=1 Tax=Cercospora beticola TaxID=122368 RepID=A0A2G5HXY3_CERBT|nr:hypothetical protein CB0940_06473 [Cercospora beticola]PIA97388.1 hypothetical protein CB0940_06473 [Cercospora beticola]WPA99111.1 hypothetical protein RHO25_003726 [Cercospora beticola]CAK1360421.1 unnamed protein product [Cercospora beticola]
MSNNNPRKRTLESDVCAIDDNTQKIVTATNVTTSASRTMQDDTEESSAQSLVIPADKLGKTDTGRTPSIQLGSLAVEIHIDIAEHCHDEDLCALRLVCRSLAKDSTDIFAARCFSKLACNISSTTSVNRLQAIVAVPEFCRRVKCFSISAICGIDAVPSDGVSFVDEQALHALTQCFRSFKEADAARSIRIEAGDDGRCFEAASYALGMSSLGIDSLSFLFKCSSVTGPIPLASLTMQNWEGLCSLWSKLKTLKMGILGTREKLANQRNGRFRQLLAKATSLKSLTLGNDYHAMSPVLRSVQELLPVSPLRQLKLVNVETKWDDLIRLLAHYHRSLRELTLCGVEIFSEAEDLWPNVLNQLEGILQLETFEADQLSRVTVYEEYLFGIEPRCSQIHYVGTKEEVSAQLKELATMGYEVNRWASDVDVDERFSLDEDEEAIDEIIDWRVEQAWEGSGYDHE